MENIVIYIVIFVIFGGLKVISQIIKATNESNKKKSKPPALGETPKKPQQNQLEKILEFLEKNLNGNRPNPATQQQKVTQDKRKQEVEISKNQKVTNTPQAVIETQMQANSNIKNIVDSYDIIADNEIGEDIISIADKIKKDAEFAIICNEILSKPKALQ